MTSGENQLANLGVNTQRSTLTGQNDCAVQVQESGCRGRVSQVIRRDINRLNGGNGPCGGRSNTLLELTHFLGQGRLITHRCRHTAQQHGYLGTSQGVAVNVVNKEQDVTALITEYLGHGQTTQGNTQTVTWRLVHLTKDHGYFGLAQVFDVNHPCLGHFVVEVVTFTSTLSHYGKDGQTAVLLGNVVNQLKHVDGLTDPSTPKQTDLTAFGERTNEVNHLDPGLEQLNCGRELVKSGGLLVNRAALISFNGAHLINGTPQYIHNAAQGACPYGNRNGAAGVCHSHPTANPITGAHGNGANHAITE